MITICVINTIIVSYLGVITVLRLTAPKLPFEAVNPTIELYYQPYNNEYSKAETKAKLNKLLNIGGYFESFMELPYNEGGKCNPYYRLIRINTNVDNNEYVWVLCHELVHLKHHTICDRYTNYLTFKYLYNSEFRAVAINLACSMRDGGFTDDYNAYMQIERWLKGEEV